MLYILYFSMFQCSLTGGGVRCVHSSQECYIYYTSACSNAPSLGAVYGVFIAYKNVIYIVIQHVPMLPHLGAAYNGCIPNSSFSATSLYGYGTDGTVLLAEYGRLNSPQEGWAPKTETNMPEEYLQIDLGALHWVCGVATQGDNGFGNNEWTTKYKISLSMNNVTWNIYQWNGSDKVTINFIKNSGVSAL